MQTMVKGVAFIPQAGDIIVLPKAFEQTVKKGRPTQTDLAVARRADKGHRHHYLLPEGAKVKVCCYTAGGSYTNYFGYNDLKVQVEYKSCTFNLRFAELEGATVLENTREQRPI